LGGAAVGEVAAVAQPGGGGERAVELADPGVVEDLQRARRLGLQAVDGAAKSLQGAGRARSRPPTGGPPPEGGSMSSARPARVSTGGSSGSASIEYLFVLKRREQPVTTHPVCKGGPLSSKGDPRAAPTGPGLAA